MEESKKANNRIEYIDIARGIAIILMVIGHVVDQGWKREVIFSFHMPLFIIASGLFYKDKSLKENIKNIFMKLILPYVICTLIVNILLTDKIEDIFNSLYSWIKQIFYSYTYMNKIKFTTGVQPIGVLWFLPVLATVKIIFIILKKVSKGNEISLFINCILVTYLGYLLGINGYWLPFSLDISIACVTFYYFGYILVKKDMLTKLLKNTKIIIAIFVFWIIGIRYNWIELCIRSYPNGAFSIITAMCGSIVVIKISQLIYIYLKRIGKILSWYGKNSMYILFLHYVEGCLINYNKMTNVITTDETILKALTSTIKLSIVTVGTLIINGIKRGVYHIKMLSKKE